MTAELGSIYSMGKCLDLLLNSPFRLACSASVMDTKKLKSVASTPPPPHTTEPMDNDDNCLFLFIHIYSLLTIQELLLSEKWARLHKTPFPPIKVRNYLIKIIFSRHIRMLLNNRYCLIFQEQVKAYMQQPVQECYVFKVH